MVAFYSQGDQDIYNSGIKFRPQQKYLLNEYTPPVQGGGQDASTPSFGIPNTNAFTNSGDNNFSSTGNAFGYGSPVSEVNVRTFNPQSNDPTGKIANAQTMYNKANNAGPMVETFTGMRPSENVMDYYGGQIMDNRQNYQANYNSPYDDTVDLGYMGRDTSTSLDGTVKKDAQGNYIERRQNKLGKFIDFTTGLLPGVGAVKRGAKFLQDKFPNPNGPGGGSYGIAGLSDAQKGAYNALAGGNMLFDGQSGMKTLTGKNFTGKGYMEGQMDLAKGFGFDTMTEEEIEDAINAEAARHGKKHNGNKGFKYKQMLESSKMYQTSKAQQEKINERNTAEAAAAAAGGNRSAQAKQRARDDNTVAQAYAGNDGYSDGSSGQQSDGSYNDPFDPGGGEKDGGFIDGSNRRPFANGGLASIL